MKRAREREIGEPTRKDAILVRARAAAVCVCVVSFLSNWQDRPVRTQHHRGYRTGKGHRKGGGGRQQAVMCFFASFYRAISRPLALTGVPRVGTEVILATSPSVADLRTISFRFSWLICRCQTGISPLLLLLFVKE